MRSLFTRHLYLPFSQAVQSERLFPVLRELERTQWQSPEDLAALSWSEVQNTVIQACREIPFYRNYEAASCQSLTSFRQLPLLKKEALRDNFELIRHPGLRKGVTQSQTSGSTGMPLRVEHGRLFRSYHEAGQWRGRKWYGVAPGDATLALWGRPFLHKSERWMNSFKSLLNNILHISIFELDRAGYVALLRQTRKFRPRFVYGYPSGLYDLARASQEEGIRLDDLGIRVVGSTAETLYPFQREVMEAAFGCPVSNVYGCSEFGAFAHQCPRGRMHISSERVLVEYLDEEGNPVAKGQPGKVVVTSMHNPEMPLIRYEVGDMAVQLDEVCPCGRSLPVMDVRAGKVGQMVRTSDGKIFSEELFSYMPRAGLARGRQGIKEFHVLQTHLDRFVIQIVPNSGDIEETLIECELGLRKVLGDSVEIEFQRVERISRSPGGKIGFFTSQVP